MSTIEAVQLIVKTYHFETPLPEELRSNMLKIKKAILVNIFRKYGRYTFFFMMTITLFFWLKKLGLGITAVKAWIIISVVTVAAAASVTAGGVFAIRCFTKPDNAAPIINTAQETPVAVKEIPATQNATSKPSATAPVITNYRSVLIPFTSAGALGNLTVQLQNDIFQRIRKTKGNAMIAMSGETKVNHPFIITGSVMKVGNDILLNIKVINSANSEVVLLINKKAQTEKDILSMSADIASQISSSL